MCWKKYFSIKAEVFSKKFNGFLYLYAVKMSKSFKHLSNKLLRALISALLLLSFLKMIFIFITFFSTKNANNYRNTVGLR